MTSENSLLHGDVTGKILACAMEVHKNLGCGFLEAVYHEPFAWEMEQALLRVEHEKELPIFYKGRMLKKKYKIDFVVEGKIAVEIKALSMLTGDDEAQMLNYIKAGGFRVGLLINFGARSLEWKRMIS